MCKEKETLDKLWITRPLCVFLIIIFFLGDKVLARPQ